MKHLPPLPALRAFEATARLGSVTRAAEELNLTHSAISHQLRGLEHLIGVALFERAHKSIHLTPAGREYAYQIRQALEHITHATQRTAHSGRSDVLRIAILPSFAAHWLIPRLPDWYTQHPEIRIDLDANLSIVDFDQDRADCAIRMGNISRDGTFQAPLLKDWQLMVAGASDARYSSEFSLAQAFSAGPVIGIATTWALWAELNQTELTTAQQPLTVNDSNLALNAAQNNMGLVLTRWSIAAHGIQNGVLKQVTSIMHPHETGYHFVRPDRSAQSHKVKVFHEWLAHQCAQFEQFTQARIEYFMR